MKLRSKLLLSATCLLTISVAATATSAYAWFTANRQVYLKSTASVNTNVTNLNVKGVTAADGDTASFATALPGTLTSGSVDSTVAITDISGDGKTFYKPELPADGSTASAMSIKQVSNGTPTDTNYYHQFKLEFTQTNTSISTGVFLANESSVDAVSSEDTNETKKNSALANSIRVSITVGSKTIYWAPNETSIANTFYLAAATPADNKSNVDLTKDGNYVNATSKITNQIIGKPKEYNDASASDKKSAATELLETLNSSVTSFTATIRVWAEGMDSDCNNDALGGHINVKLVFNGVNMNI